MDAPHNNPDRIGDYRIRRKLGEGGMGAVFEAEQDNPRRTVALKVVTGGVQSEEMRRRFEQEAQVLGHLQHVAIAHVYEAGIAGAGIQAQPFFAMELIRGETLPSHASRHGLDARERLELIARICDGIEHAHGRGVIHRDLKPDNILVDQEGQPKILDFGIARVTEADIRTATLRTDVGQIMGTVPYMSPEQALGDPAGIGPESDVYSLGVVAYELLTGKLPYPSDHGNVLEALRIVREEEARPASSVDRSLSGDIETMLAKALEKNVERRYRSASAFGADIRRFLANEPILARPQSTFYQLSKFARRNRALVSGMAAVFLALILGLIGTAVGFIEARAETKRANQVSRFLQDILAGVNPAIAQGQDTTLLKAILDRTAARIEHELAGAPRAEAEIRSAMANSYYGIGAFQESHDHAVAALALLQESAADDEASLFDLRRRVAVALSGLERYAEAESALIELKADVAEVFGPAHARTDEVAGELATMHLELADYALAAQELEPLVARRRARGESGDDYFMDLNRLGVSYLYLHRIDEAQELLEESHAGWRRDYGDAHPETFKAANNLAATYAARSDFEKAEELYRDSLARAVRVLGEDHVSTVATRMQLATCLRDQGRDQEVVEVLLPSVEFAHPDSDMALDARSSLAKAYDRLGRPREALGLLEDVYATRLRLSGPENLRTLTSQKDLARLLVHGSEKERGFELYEQAVEGVRRIQGDDDRLSLVFMNDLAVAYQSSGRFDEAEALTESVLESRRRVLGDRDRSTLQSVYTLAVIYIKTGRVPQGLALYGEVMDGWAAIHGDQDRLLGEMASRLRAEAQQGTNLGAFEPGLRALVAYDRRVLASDDPQLGIDLASHTVALHELDREDEALELRDEAEEILMRVLDNPDTPDGTLEAVDAAWERMEASWQ